MSEAGKIRASDLLDEKALIVFQELEKNILETAKAIEKLRETNIHLGNVTMKNGADSIALQQKIKSNIESINALRKITIDLELQYIGILQNSETKRKQVADAEEKRQKKAIADKEKAAAEEEKSIKEIIALRTKYAKQAEAAENKRAAAFIKNAKDEAEAVKKAEREKSTNRKAAITALATGYLAIVQAGRQILSGWNKIVGVLTTLDNFSNLMERLTGTTSEAADSMEYLIDISRRYGLDLQTATERYSKFYAAAKQANLTITETRNIFSSVSKVSGILGLKADELSGVFLALEQMLSKGKVTTEELRRQLGERLPGAFGIMAKAVDVLNPGMNVTISNLDEMLKKGEIISRDVMPEFARQLEIAFNAMDVNRVQTLAAAQTSFNTSITQLVYTLENGQGTISNFFRGIYDGLTSNIDAMREWIELMGATDEQIRTLATLKREYEQLAPMADFWGDSFDFKNRAEEAKKAYADYLKEIKDGIKEEQLHVKLVEDWSNNIYQLGLNYRKMGDEAEEAAILADLVARADEKDNTWLQDNLRMLQEANDEREQAAKYAVNSIGWLDEQIKLEKDLLSTQGTMNSLDDIAIKNAKFRLKALEDYRKELAILLGLEERRKDSTKKGPKDKPVYPLQLTYLDGDSQADLMIAKIAEIKKELKGLTEYEVERRDVLEEQLKWMEMQLAIERTTAAGGTFQLPGSKPPIVNNEDLDKKRLQAAKETADAMEQIYAAGTQLANEMFEIGNSLFERRIENIQAEMNAVEEMYDAKLLLAQGDAEAEKDLEIERELRLSALRKRELKEKQKMAKFEKAQAITSAAIGTALGIVNALATPPAPLGLILASLIGAIGAAQTAAIIAAPIPQYKMGREGGPDEWAITGDGGKHEWVVGDAGIMKTPKVPTLTHLNKGDSVLKDDKALQNFIYKTLLKEHNIELSKESREIEKAIDRGFAKARINNFVKMPPVKVSIDNILWINRNSQFGR